MSRLPQRLLQRFLQRFLQWSFLFGLAALVLTCLTLAGCASSTAPATTSSTTSARQARTEADVAACIEESGARGVRAAIRPDGSFQGEWASGAQNPDQWRRMVSCMDSRGYTVDRYGYGRVR